MSESNIKFKLEGIVTVGERGQIVLPKDLRKRAVISPNDKLVLISFKNKEESAIILTKNDANGISRNMQFYKG